MTETTNQHDGDSKTPDLISEATAQATAGATTDTHADMTYTNSDATGGRVPHPDLAPGEAD
jgi:hypothetical protein